MNVKSALLGVLWVGAVAPFFTGCATVTRGTKEVVVVESEPSGASVHLSNGMVGTTPTSFKVPRKGAFVVDIKKEGYEPVVVNVNTQVAGAGAAGMAGNVLVGGIIGVGIDSFSGGMLEHKPNPIRVTLVPLKQSPEQVAGRTEPGELIETQEAVAEVAASNLPQDEAPAELVAQSDSPITVPTDGALTPVDPSGREGSDEQPAKVEPSEVQKPGESPAEPGLF